MKSSTLIALLLSCCFGWAHSSNNKQIKLSDHNINMMFSINNYNYNLHNKLVNTYELNAQPTNNKQSLQTKNATWQIDTKFSQTIAGTLDATIEFILLQGTENNSAVAINFEIDKWSKSNYVLLPAAAYNGNRFESRKIPYSPKLNDYRDIGPQKPMIISDVPRLNIHEGPSQIQERSGSMTTPMIGFHSFTQKNGMILTTTQANAWGDYGMYISETRPETGAKAIIGISSPLVREGFKYEIANHAVASPDKPANFKKGDTIKFNIRIRLFKSENLANLYENYYQARYDLTPTSTPNYIYPFSECFNTIEQKFNTQNFVPEWGYYAVGMRENFLQDWQIGWTGGMISTYPLLFSNNTQTTQNIIANFNWLFPNGISPSGFFWDSGEKGNKWYGGDIRRPQFENLHLIRKSGDGLYYVIKQFDLMKKRNIKIEPEWHNGAETVANAFVKLWGKWGQYGNFVDSRTGDVVVGGSTSGAIVPAALALASEYYNNPVYMTIAKLSAQKLYAEYVSKGITCGGPGDAMQNPDSESAYAMLESFSILYEKTGEKQWLQYANEMALQFATWVMAYDYKYDNNCLFGRMKMKTKGTVFANTQNKHGSPGICTHSGLALMRLYRATGKSHFLELLQEITLAIPQYMSHNTRTIADMPAGWINERVSTTDWFEGIGEIKAGSTWAETAMLLTTIELPSIYVDIEMAKSFTFDNLQAQIIKNNKNTIHLKVYNPTKFASEFNVLLENKEMKSKSWVENRIFALDKFKLKAGETKILKLKK